MDNSAAVNSETTNKNNTNGKSASKGRRRVEIKKVEEKNKRHVTFSKRKKGLFNKAAELSVLTGAEMAGIVVSSNGKVFCFGNPNADAVIHRYLGQNACLLPSGQLVHHDQHVVHHHPNSSHADIMHSSSKQVEDYLEAKRRMEAEKIKRNNDNNNNNNTDEEKGAYGGWWEKQIDETTSLEELEEYMAALHQLKHCVRVRTNQMTGNVGCNLSSPSLPDDDRLLVKGDQLVM